MQKSQNNELACEVILRSDILFVYVHVCPLLSVFLKDRQTDRHGPFHNSSSKLSFTQFEDVLHPSLQKGYTRELGYFEAIVLHW